MEKESFLIGIILGLCKKDEKITFAEIAQILNRRGYKTDRGEPYVEGGIGMGKLISSLHKRAMFKEDIETANAIANTVVNTHGNPAW